MMKVTDDQLDKLTEVCFDEAIRRGTTWKLAIADAERPGREQK